MMKILKPQNHIKLFYAGCLFLIISALTGCQKSERQKYPLTKTTTLAGFNREFGEPFGVAIKENSVYVSDGEQGKIFRVSRDGKIEVFSDKFNTPSQIAFNKNGDLIVADSGSNTIKKISPSGEIELIAGTENQKGFKDGETTSALFNAPIGVTVFENKIFVADTYNDKIRVIENGQVSTLAGSTEGFADGAGNQAKFDTPSGLAVTKTGNLVVADLKNKRIRLVEPNGSVSTLAGNGEQDSVDGLPQQARFVAPTAVTIDNYGVIYVADGNSIRAIGRRILSLVERISGKKRGFADGVVQGSRLNRPSGLAIDENGNLFVADSDNQVIRLMTGEDFGSEITKDQIAKIRYTPEEFRTLQPARWTYNPPDAKRDVAGTLGEIRGEVVNGKGSWFHNGLDIAGSYGETARFVRTEKVLQPVATEDFGGLRERLRMSSIGYIHIRLGRDASGKIFDDKRFQFLRDDAGKLNAVRIPRGTKFEAGEPVGTLNPMNHVHLIAGRVGAEMNALDALVFPNIDDTIAPTIEKVSLFDENWRPVETQSQNSRIKLNGKFRIVVRAFDRMNGNANYRKLGIYRLGYQILREDKTPLSEAKLTISFEKMPDEDFVSFVYAPGSKSGYSPQTIFDYVVTNEVNGDSARENFLDTDALEKGNYVLRASASDFFGNITNQDVNVEIVK